ncbi:GNAT family N-acetyltransferase [Deinococcus sp. KSM4-11]|uniref:GNAT family N-acetyltransferase n=1 Tax=Deinococcus sp. KSM4-11 TaxID=2568654 RepID=UPI0010A4383A|nr:GNAT family N-acetyltransferase [Deinococcus sp. KSM4-11]THF85589.1 GNAT family N-acetyltransferase [Deinococcus sp. KSM4-11]
MIEIRPFDGDAAELAALINASWQGRYLARDLIPVYDGPGLQWQVLGVPDHSLHLSAWDGARLVGCFLADHVTLRVAGQAWRGSQGSYFSVHPEYAARGVARRLLAALERAHREQALAFMLGYVNSSRSAPAYQFWSRFEKAFPTKYTTLRSVGFWMRFLQPRRMAAVMDHAAEALGLRALSVLQRPPQDRCGVRPFTAADAVAAHLLLDRAALHSSVAQLWEPGALRTELTGAHTLVFPLQERVGGFSTSFPWPLRSRGVIPAEVIDLLLMNDLNPEQRRTLLNATAHASAARGAWVSIAPTSDWRHGATFAACGFVPIPKVCTLMMLFPDKTLDLHAARHAKTTGPLRFR